MERTGLPKDKADICFDIADRYAASLKIDSAIYFAAQTKELSEPIHYETGVGKYHLIMAQVLILRNRNAEAEENTLKAVAIFSRQKEIILLGRAYIALGNGQYRSNKVASSRKNYWTAMAIFEKMQEPNGLYSCYWWMARGYFKTSEIDSASFYFIGWIGDRITLRRGQPRKQYSFIGSLNFKSGF